MNSKTFKETDSEIPVEKEVRKAGLSLAIIFSKEDIKRFSLEYLDKIDLSNAKIIKKEKMIVE